MEGNMRFFHSCFPTTDGTYKIMVTDTNEPSARLLFQFACYPSEMEELKIVIEELLRLSKKEQSHQKKISIIIKKEAKKLNKQRS